MPLRDLRRRAAQSRILAFLAVIGPGIIAASAGNDAGGVTTYSLAGSRFGYSLLWVILLLTFSLAVAQEMGARMAAVTGKGLADLIREEFGVRVAMLAMAALVLANIATTVAEFAGIAVALELFLPPGARFLAVPAIALTIWLLIARGSYQRVERVFLAMCLVYLAYVFAAFLARPDWGRVATGALSPFGGTGDASLGEYVRMLVALIGTTIAPWMQFYVQSSVRDKGLTAEQFPLERVDVLSGAVLSNAISFFIVVTCAATIWVSGGIAESGFDGAVASRALEPAAGRWASALFAIGLFNAAMVGAIAVPLSTAYAVTESLGWESGIGRRIREAPLFILVYTLVLFAGAALVLLPGSRLFALIVGAQVINGALLPVVLALMLLLVNKRRLMGDFVNGRFGNAVGIATAGVVSALSIVYLGWIVIGG